LLQRPSDGYLEGREEKGREEKGREEKGRKEKGRKEGRRDAKDTREVTKED
jgi:hypothetical protein